MLSKRQIKYLEKYCAEPIEWIENYQEAISDNQRWCCHHRLEIDLHMTREQLKYLGLYYKVPANELIFLTEVQHKSLHMKGKKGVLNPNYGKPTWNKGKKNVYSEETLRKMSEAMTGTHWYNNNIIEIHAKECPPGFVSGRLKYIK